MLTCQNHLQLSQVKKSWVYNSAVGGQLRQSYPPQDDCNKCTAQAPGEPIPTCHYSPNSSSDRLITIRPPPLYTQDPPLYKCQYSPFTSTHWAYDCKLLYKARQDCFHNPSPNFCLNPHTRDPDQIKQWVYFIQKTGLHIIWQLRNFDRWLVPKEIEIGPTPLRVLDLWN